MSFRVQRKGGREAGLREQVDVGQRRVDRGAGEVGQHLYDEAGDAAAAERCARHAQDLARPWRR